MWSGRGDVNKDGGSRFNVKGICDIKVSVKGNGESHILEIINRNIKNDINNFNYL